MLTSKCTPPVLPSACCNAHACSLWFIRTIDIAAALYHAVSRHAHGQSCHLRLLPHRYQSLQVIRKSLLQSNVLFAAFVHVLGRQCNSMQLLFRSGCLHTLSSLLHKIAAWFCDVYVCHECSYGSGCCMSADLQKACSLPWKATFRHPRLLRTVQLTWSITW